MQHKSDPLVGCEAVEHRLECDPNGFGQHHLLDRVRSRFTDVDVGHGYGSPSP